MATKEEVMETRKEVIVMENDGSKLCKQLISLVDFWQGNNYEDTHIRVEIYESKLVVSTRCVNEYGSTWCNENHTSVSKSNIPFFTLKKLGMM